MKGKLYFVYQDMIKVMKVRYCLVSLKTKDEYLGTYQDLIFCRDHVLMEDLIDITNKLEKSDLKIIERIKSHPFIDKLQYGFVVFKQCDLTSFTSKVFQEKSFYEFNTLLKNIKLSCKIELQLELSV